MKMKARFKIKGKWTKWYPEGSEMPKDINELTAMEEIKTMKYSEAIKLYPELASHREK